MQIVIDIDENVFTRLFDNGIEDYAIVNDDLFTIAKSIRNCIPLPKGHGVLKDEKDLDLFAPSLGTDEYVDDLMAKHNIDYVNGDDEDKVKAFALDLIASNMNVIETAPTIIEADKEDS